MLHRAYGSEDARTQLPGVNIYLNWVGCRITTATSTRERWPTTVLDRSPDSMINKTLFKTINIEFMYVMCTLPYLKKIFECASKY
jgi:hypothetical protein